MKGWDTYISMKFKDLADNRADGLGISIDDSKIVNLVSGNLLREQMHRISSFGQIETPILSDIDKKRTDNKEIHSSVFSTMKNVVFAVVEYLSSSTVNITFLEIIYTLVIFIMLVLIIVNYLKTEYHQKLSERVDDLTSTVKHLEEIIKNHIAAQNDLGL